jgi:two-component system, OmpR family, phosphate regulon sensor histidine kinase PhoR
MKLSRTTLFIAISSFALLIVLGIQVNSIFRTARTKEDLFNEKANLVLARTTDALLKNEATCKKIECSEEKKQSYGYTAVLEKNEIRTIDSLLAHFMNFYSFRVPYTFEVIKSNRINGDNRNMFINSSDTTRPGCYTGDLKEAVNKNGFELKLDFPAKNQFILAEMGTWFMTSLILIILVLVLFWKTVLALMKEKRISEHTTDFLNNMTHEFKTPLTNIALAGKMIVRDSNLKQEDKIKHYSAIILEENEKLRLQVEQVLSMTALERGEIPLQKTEVDIHELIQNSFKYMSVQIESRQGSLKLNLEAERFVVMGDKIHLTNALCNLADNAIKYSNGSPELSVHTYNKDQNIIMVISDKGIGIEKEYQDKVFDKYFRVPTGDVHNVKGFGLGLAYIKKIIDMHGGSIGLQSEKGTGTTVTVTLPNV